jgi:hypothetical protein
LLHTHIIQWVYKPFTKWDAAVVPGSQAVAGQETTTAPRLGNSAKMALKEAEKWHFSWEKLGQMMGLTGLNLQ